MNANQRRIASRKALREIGGIGTKAIPEGSKKPAVVVGKANPKLNYLFGFKSECVEIKRGDSRRFNFPVSKLTPVKE